jgi:hypothetical protein
VAADGGPSDLGFNTFVGNNIARVHAQVADVFLDHGSHDTVLKGDSGTVIDLGTNNRIAGFTKGGQRETGQPVSEDTHLRSAAINDAGHAHKAITVSR